MLQVLIANRLIDGFVVFLTDDGQWTSAIGEGALAESDEAAAALLATGQQAADDNVVVDPYLIPVVMEDGTAKPVEYREYIRASGPTVPIPA